MKSDFLTMAPNKPNQTKNMLLYLAFNEQHYYYSI